MGRTTKSDHRHESASIATQRQGAQAVEREITGGQGQATPLAPPTGAQDHLVAGSILFRSTPRLSLSATDIISMHLFTL
jgi:hypothetical protein